MQNVRGYSSKSAQSYGFCLGKFHYWLQLARRYDSETQVSPLDVNEFIAWCRSECGLKPSSINLHRTALSSYFRYCVRYHAYACNPVDETSPMREPRLLPQCVLMEDVQSVLENCPDTYTGHQLRAIVLAMCHCGLRVQEVCDLRPASLRPGFLLVEGKGSKMRSVPLSSACDAALHQVLRERDKLGFSDVEWLFVNERGQQLSRSAMYHRVHDAFVQFSGKALAHPHALRHTFATFCLVHGMTLPQVSAWLGHSSYATTMRYLSVVGSPKNPFEL